MVAVDISCIARNFLFQKCFETKNIVGKYFFKVLTEPCIRILSRNCSFGKNNSSKYLQNCTSVFCSRNCSFGSEFQNNARVFGMRWAAMGKSLCWLSESQYPSNAFLQQNHKYSLVPNESGVSYTVTGRTSPHFY